MHMFQFNTVLGSTQMIRRLLLSAGLALVASGLLAGCYKQEKSAASSEVMQSGDGAKYLAHEVIVQRNPEISAADFEAAVESLGGTVTDEDSLVSKRLGYFRIQLPEDVTADEAVSKLQEDGATKTAERNFVVSLERTPDDPNYSQLWGLAKIQAEDAWEETVGSRDIIVAVTDTGVDRSHPDLAVNMWTNAEEIAGNGVDDDGNGYVDDVYGWDFANSDADPSDDHGHGTHCSGTIGASGNDGTGIPGVNWQVKIMAVKFLSASGGGSLWAGAQSILYAAEKGAKVVNASWGCRGCYTEYMQNAIETLEEAGGLFVAAAGNSATDIDSVPFYPAGHGNANIVSVTAVDSTDGLASFSNWGASKVDLGAPGVSILSTLPSNRYGSWNGTSMAAPHVSGAAALFLSKYPDTGLEVLKNRILQTADPVSSLSGKSVSGGRLNVYRMFADDADPPSAPTLLTGTSGSQNDVLLSWNPVTDEDLSLYRVKYGPASESYAQTLDVPASQNTATVADLEAETPYFFAVFAVDEAGNESAPSNEISLSTGDTEAPPQVLDLTAAPVPGGIVSGYLFASSSEASSYYSSENALDGSVETAWAAKPSETNQEEYLVLQLFEPVVLDRVVLTPMTAYPEFFPVDFDVELSPDGADWIVVGGMRGATVDDDTPVEITFPAVQASALRLTIHRSHEHESGLFYAGIAEMTAYSVTQDPDMIRLMFTAPGDDPGQGRAKSYDIRYSVDPLTEDNFAEATSAKGGMPSEAGLIEEVRVENLAPETPYFFALKAVDDAGNVSLMSNVAMTSTVIVPPGAVQDLSVFSVENNAVTLTWRAPGKDAYEGRASEYDLRWSLEPLTAANFDAAERFSGAPLPSEAGEREYVTVTGLQHKNYYYFAVRAIDEKGHEGGISNVVSVKTEHDGNDNIPPSTVFDLSVYESTAQSPLDVAVLGASSRVQESYFEYHLTDGSLDTMWISAEGEADSPEWVTFDLSAPEPVSEVRLHPATFGGLLSAFPQDFEIQASADGVLWTTVHEAFGQRADCSGWISRRFDVISARYLRLFISLRGIDSCGDTSGCTLPSKVALAEFEVYGPTSEYDVDLVWTAPGDDEWDGAAYAYDLRHSTDDITIENFDLAVSIPIPPPYEGGSLEAVTVGDLAWGIPHFFALKTVDDTGNWSEMSNVAVIGAPAIPPSPVNDLVAHSPTQYSVELGWTAVGDDNLEGRAAAYDVRYSMLPITPENWKDAAPVLNVPLPKDSGEAEALSVTGLVSGTRYFFALKAIDDEGRESLLSNVAFETTLDTVPPYRISDLNAEPVEPEDDPPLPAVIGEHSGSYAPTADPENLLDGNENTAWLSPKRTSASSFEFVRFDLEKSVRVGTLRLVPAPDYEDMFPVDFKVEVREDEEGEWITVINETGFVVENDAEEWSVGSVWAKQVRLVVTRLSASNGGYFSALSEFEIIEDPTRFDAIIVSWTAPSDPEDEHVSAYDLRRDRKPIGSEPNFAGAVPIESKAPKDAGMPERLEVLNLENETEYCFAIKSEDSIGNVSELSDSPCAVTRGMPPATTVDLALTDVTARTASVSWTAPGDDWMEGQAYRYDIRVFEKRINRETWDLARVVAVPPAPAMSGVTESYTIEGLEGDTDYYIALRAYDEADNESGISNNVKTRSKDDVPPSEVQDLFAETNFDEWGSLIVTWTAPGDSGPLGQASEYDLRVLKDPITESNFASAIRVSAPAPSPSGALEEAVLVGLDPEALYYVALKSLDEGQNASALSNNASARTRDEAPGEIDDLSASALSGTDPNDARVSLSLTAPGDDAYQGTADHYDIRYAEGLITETNFDQATPFETDVAPASAGVAQDIVVSGLKTGQTYFFAVKTVDERGNVSAISNVASTKTKDEVSPGPVLDLVAETGLSRGTVRLSWTHTGDDNSQGACTSYDLRWSYTQIDAQNFEQATKTLPQPVCGTAGSVTSVTALGLPDEELLHFALKAADDAGNLSALSNDAAARTRDVAPARIVDLAQTGATLTEITATWTAVGDDENVGVATSYDMRLSSSLLNEANFYDAEPVSLPSPMPAGSTETIVIDKLSSSSVYYLAVKAEDERGNISPISNVAIIGTVDDTPPGIIDDLTPSTGVYDGEIKLRWTATGDDGDVGTADRYELRYSLECITEDNWDAAISATDPPAPRVAYSQEAFTVKNLEGETFYYFAIRAVDEAGNIGDLAAGCFGADTKPVPPSAVNDLAGTPTTPRSVVLTWTAPGADEDEGTAAAYDIRYALFQITEVNFSIATPMQNPPTPKEAGSAETATVTGLEESTTYYFALKAVDDLDAVSPLSNTVQVTTLDETPPAAPYDVILSARNDTSGTVFAPKSVTASSQLADTLGPENVMDEDDYSMWVSDGVSAPGPEWIEMELEEAGRIDRVRLLPNPDYLHLFPASFKVEVSEDRTVWDQVLVVEDFEAPSDAWMTFGFEPSTGKYIRVTSFDPVISYFGLYYTVISGMEAVSAAELSGGMQLLWTAPGDDDMEGTAERYELYYHTAAFDESSLDTASLLPNPPAPEAAGTIHSLVVEGLIGERRYYFAIRAVDEAGNIGPLSELVTAVSSDAPPSAVTDLQIVSTDMNSVTLSFTATGDDGRTGRADRYELRYAPWSLTQENFPFATAADDVPSPEDPGKQQSVTVTGLEPGTLYRFALKVFDENNNVSYLSNVARAETVPEPDDIAPAAAVDLAAKTVTDANSVILGTVTARTSEQPPEFTADAVIDGDKNTFWASAAAEQSSEEQLTLALASVSPVKEMKIYPASGYESLFPLGVEIEVSADGLDWRTVFTKSNHAAEKDTPLVAAFPVTAVKLIRFTVTETAQNNNGYFYAAISEIEVIHAEAVPGTVTVSWTAVGDDDMEGTADFYDLRIGPCPLDFDAATPISTDAPRAPSTPEIARILDLAEGTYCIGLIVEDEVGNRSPLSNIAQVYTPGTGI